MSKKKTTSKEPEYIGYSSISKERKKARIKARKERERRSLIKIVVIKIKSPFFAVRNKIETRKFIVSKSSKRIVRKLEKSETGISERAASVIAGIDENSEKKIKGVKEGLKKLKVAIENKNFIDGARNKQVIGATISMMVAAVMIIGAFNFVTAYEYSYKGRPLGIVSEQQDVTEIIEVVNSQLTKEHSANVNLKAQDGTGIEFRRVVALDSHIQTPDEVLTTLTYMQDITVSAYGIFVDGKRTSVVATEKEAEETVEEIIGYYTKQTEGVEYVTAEYKELVEIKPTEVKLGTVEDKEKAKEEIMTGVTVEQGHIVESGDTMDSIAKEYGISVGEIEEANPNADKTSLVLGETIKIITKEPLVNVTVVANVSSVREMPFETEKTDDSSLFLNSERIVEEGVNGEEKIEARITYVNGEIVEEEIFSQTIIKEPVNEKILVGTRELPPSIGYGTFINPYAGGILTSPYGMRWGSMHNGVDLAGPTGSPIIASDGGTVTFSGWNGAYGMTVEIYHGDGNSTLYAHCSELLVSVGDSVFQGQDIAKVGSTGFSTGPHVHFEVNVNGERVNPADVIPI